MLLSIIIPVYNTAQYLERCLDSCLQQNLPEDAYEIICINDGSTDGSKEILDKYSGNHKNIVVIHKANAGQSAARNEGINKANGEYIFFVDSDDYIESNSLKNILDIATSRKPDILTFSSITHHTGNSATIDKESNTILTDKAVLYTGVDFVSKIDYQNTPWWYITKLSYIKEKEILFQSGHFYEDVMFTAECLLRAESVIKTDHLVYHYVIRAGSTTTNHNPEHLKKIINDYFVVADRLNYLSSVSSIAHAKLCNRRDSIIFFLLIRILKLKPSRKTINSYITRLRDLGYYPIEKSPLKGLKERIIFYILNKEFLFHTACQLYRLIR